MEKKKKKVDSSILVEESITTYKLKLEKDLIDIKFVYKSYSFYQKK